MLRDVAITSMQSKSASGQKEHLADIAVKAVTTVAEEQTNGRYFVDEDVHYTLKRADTSSHMQIVASIREHRWDGAASDRSGLDVLKETENR